MRKAPQLDGPGQKAFHQTPQGDLLLQEVEKWGFVLVWCMCFFSPKKNIDLFTKPAKKRQRLQICFNSFRTLLKQQSQILKFPERFLDFFEVLVLWFGCLSPSYLDFKRNWLNRFFAKEKRAPGLFPRLFLGGIYYPVIWGFDNQWS